MCLLVRKGLALPRLMYLGVGHLVDYDKIKKKLATMLSSKRFEHSISTMETAICLAQSHGYDTDKAKLAGLLHDCAKGYEPEKMLMLCEKYGILPDEVTQRTLGLLHQLLGAKVARDEFGIEDIEVLNAIRCHTTGKTNMSTLDKIIYLADFTEPNRKPFEGLEKLRRLATVDLDAAMLMALDISIRHIISKGKLLHLDTVNARNQFLILKN